MTLHPPPPCAVLGGRSEKCHGVEPGIAVGTPLDLKEHLLEAHDCLRLLPATLT